MGLSHRLEFRQSQALVMTPQLMQAIKLLQFSNLELAAYVESELERNPLLQEADDAGRSGEAGAAEGSDGASAPVQGRPNDGEDLAPLDRLGQDLPTAEAISAALDIDASTLFPDDGPGLLDPAALVGDAWVRAGTGGRAPGDDGSFPEVAASTASLHDHLLAQLSLAVSDPARRLIGQFLVDAIDEAGYLRADLSEIAEKLGADLSLVEQVLRLIQGFDPTGVGARDLEECLCLQLAERDRLDPAMRALLARLDLVAKRDFIALKRICGVDEEDLADMIAEVRRLEPKPGRIFGSAVLQPVVPDVLVRPAADGGWQVELNTETLPRVLVDRSYYARVAKTARGEAEKSYLSERLQSANWLVKSLDQRATTILKVATEIVRQQDAFFVHGVAHLRPLTLRLVADAIGMHESTVSRVTTNKYVATPRGIFELKYFFTSSIAAADGGNARSSEAVRHRIKALIDAEGANNILSDDTLVKRLRDEGIDIARRTVAKYREALKIPSSVERRREKLYRR